MFLVSFFLVYLPRMASTAEELPHLCEVITPYSHAQLIGFCRLFHEGYIQNQNFLYSSRTSQQRWQEQVEIKKWNMQVRRSLFMQDSWVFGPCLGLQRNRGFYWVDLTHCWDRCPGHAVRCHSATALSPGALTIWCFLEVVAGLLCRGSVVAADT